MREIRPSGSEGGGTSLRSPYPYRRWSRLRRAVYTQVKNALA